MTLAMSRVKGGQLLSSNIEVWKLFENRFGFTYDQILPYLSVVFGLGVTVLFLLLVWGLYKWVGKRKSMHLGNFVLAALVTLGVVLMPTPLLGSMVTENTCGGDVLAAYETVGRQLQERIPAGSTVYWAGSSVVTPLLYLPDVYVQPQLLNGVYSKRVGGDREELEKNGYYNQDSMDAWRAEADFVVNNNTKMIGSWLTFLNADDFDEYQHTDALDPCDPTSFLRIYKAKDK